MGLCHAFLFFGITPFTHLRLVELFFIWLGLSFWVMKLFSELPNRHFLRDDFFFFFCGVNVQALVVLLSGLGRFLKMGRLGQVGRCW